MNSMLEVLSVNAGKWSDRLCIVDNRGEYTYREIWNQVLRIAQVLMEQNVRKSECVMVECTQDAWYLICDFACELIGAIFVPVEHKASLERVKDILSETNAGLFIYDADYDVPVKMLKMEEMMQYEKKAITELKHFPMPDATAEILYTTGTTGKSKGIEITNQNNIALAENIMYGTEMKPANVELIPLPISHSHGLRCCYANILNGGTVVLMDGVTKVKQVFDLLARYHVTAIDLSPSAAVVLMKLSKGKFSEYGDQLDYIQIGTAALPEETKRMLIEKFPTVRLYNFYGSTESGRTCVLDFNRERDKANCIGRPTKNAHFIVTDDERNEISSSAKNTGLLASSGLMNMKGYWKQPELTATTMHDGYVYTNDLGYIDDEGYVYVLGRKDDIINYKGIKIAPEEIEESVKRYDGVIDCACVPKEDKMSGHIPKLYVVVNDKEKFSAKDLMKFLEQYVDGNKMPKEVSVIDEIPRTYNGKIQRAKLIGRE